jgi:hypothetical protein
MINSPGLVSESFHESTFKLIRDHNFNDVLFSVGATWIGHGKHVSCNTLTHSTNEDLLNIKCKGDPKSRTLSRTSDASSNNKTLNARLLARVITGCHYT